MDFSNEINALKSAIASGAKSVSYDGKSVTYDDLDAMYRRLRWLEAQGTGGATRLPKAGLAKFSRG
jgi:hypothetical protein